MRAFARTNNNSNAMSSIFAFKASLIKLEQHGMNISVLGAAKSGMAAALLAKRLGHEVFLSEFRPSTDCSSEITVLDAAGIPWEMGGHSEKVFENCELIISSPGIKPSAPVLLQADHKGIPVISELEFASRHTSQPIIAVTGTNGKTTTTSLISYLLNRSGRTAIACGNIGTPLSAVVMDAPADTIFVVECSSYQLDRCVSFRPRVAIVLNITPDHLQYHGTVDNYASAKWKISQNQSLADTLILCDDDSGAASVPSSITASILRLSATHPVQQGMLMRDGALVFIDQHKEEFLMHQGELCLPGIHNVYNSMAAALAARVFEIRNEDIRDSLMSFSGVEHRLEPVRVIGGVEYVNDSKATNINATWYALQAYQRPIVLIAGGRGDNNEYSLLDALVQKNVRCIIAIGEEQEAIFQHFCAMVRCIKADDLSQAVRDASEQAEPDDVVLFSPACKSFDMFMNYEHRGEVFKEYVESLIEA